MEFESILIFVPYLFSEPSRKGATAAMMLTVFFLAVCSFGAYCSASEADGRQSHGNAGLALHSLYSQPSMYFISVIQNLLSTEP
jgi:hypothetical protein